MLTRRVLAAPDGDRLAYWTEDAAGAGSGAAAPPILWLHSLGTDHRLWSYQVPAFADRRQVFWDARGHGESTARQGVSVQKWVDDIRALMAAEGGGRWILAGISMGGVQALAFQEQYSEAVAGLVLADTFMHLDPPVAAAKMDASAGQVSRPDMTMESYADMYLDATLMASGEALAVRSELKAAIAGMDAENYIASATACFTADVQPRSPVPALILIGERDEKTPRRYSEEILNRLPGADFVVVPGAGHLSCVDNPADFTKTVGAFVKSTQA